MKRTASLWLGRSLLVITAAISSACSDTTQYGTTAPQTAAIAVRDNRPDLGGCEFLAAPDGSQLLLSAFGVGVQIYHWNGTSWGAPTPSATLYADAGLHAVVASHFAGPTWQSNSGGKVVGTVLNRCTVDAASIQWLSLAGVADGPGIFQHVTFIQRLHTVGGIAPSTAGTVIGEERQVPYTADYLFYKAP
jgi:uncharacterized protein DUF3455